MERPMIKTNYHTHSSFCDGENTPEEMVKAAVERKFDILGFSSHSMLPFSSGWHLPVHSHREYIAEIQRLKEQYKERITVYAGFEADYIAGVCRPDFECYKEFKPDYLIGSVHFVPGKKGFFEADGSRESVLAGIKSCFGGNVKNAVREYFSLEKEMLETCSFSILGHTDVIRKQNGGGYSLFDENAAWYRSELKSVASAAARAGICVEVNTGGMLRSQMKSPYPSLYFLSLLRERNVPVTISSDAHSAAGLDWQFEETVEYIKSAGYTELAYYKDGGFKMQRLC